MTTITWALDAVEGAPEYTGRALRQTMSPFLDGATDARPIGARTGVRKGTPAATVSTSSFDWTVGVHSGVLDLQASAIAGPYCYAVTVAETGTITAAHATLARVDLLYVQVDDPAESDGSTVPAVTVNYLAGTAAGSPVAPATPARSMVLGTISVPASGGGDPSATWTALYTVAAGGIIPVRSIAEAETLRGALDLTTQNPLYVHVAGVGLLASDDGTTWGADKPAPTVETFEAGGTWNKPAGLKAVRVQVCGGGGGGGGVGATGAGEGSESGGGGGGGTRIAIIPATDLPNSVSVTVGTGGTGGSGSSSGSTGEDSSFGAFAVGAAGLGGAGRAAVSSFGGAASGVGGSGSGTADGFTVPGDDGNPGMVIDASSPRAVRNNGGGGSFFAGHTRNAGTTSDEAGTNGKTYGGGGSGARNGASQSARSGGNGATGVVVVENLF